MKLQVTKRKVIYYKPDLMEVNLQVWLQIDVMSQGEICTVSTRINNKHLGWHL